MNVRRLIDSPMSATVWALGLAPLALAGLVVATGGAFGPDLLGQAGINNLAILLYGGLVSTTLLGVAMWMAGMLQPTHEEALILVLVLLEMLSALGAVATLSPTGGARLGMLLAFAALGFGLGTGALVSKERTVQNEELLNGGTGEGKV